ncbi:hypothetical protein [Ramlibacter sp.]|uniref:hypothetical protein n=1 Tax=Ramlibacter sp. TaxID=1917967 RepID=UPI003D13A258
MAVAQAMRANEPQQAQSQDGTSVALRLHQAWYGTAPSNTDMRTYAATVSASGALAQSNRFANDAAGLSDTALAQRVLDNTRITAASTNPVSYSLLRDAVGQIFAAYGPAARGQIVLNLVNLLIELEADASFANAARSFNQQVSANAAHSASAVSAATVRTSTYTSAYNECFVGTPLLYTTTYCDAYAAARDQGASASAANTFGASAAGSNVGNIGMGGTITSTGTPAGGSTGGTSSGGTSSGGTSGGTSSGGTSSGGTSSGGTSSGGTSSGGTSTGGSRPANIDWTSSYSADEQVNESPTLRENERKGWTFNVTGAPMDIEVVFAAQYSADLYVMDAGSVNACVNGGSFNYYPNWSFRGQYGFNSFTMPVGNYGLCLVNRNRGSNATRFEFQRQLTVSGFAYDGTRFPIVAQSVSAGSRFVQTVTVGANYRVIIDGANSGGVFYVIPTSEQANFLAGRGFRYYTSEPCAGADRAAPGLCEIRSAGEYALAYHNDTSQPQSIVIVGRDYVPR